jgi:opacity protein-like surface antigen
VKKAKILFVIILMAFVSKTAGATQFEFMTFAGLRTGGHFSVTGEDFVRFSFDDGLTYGLTFGIVTRSNFQVEFMWSREDSLLRASLLGGSGLELFDVHVDQYHLNFVILLKNGMSRVQPYILIGLGATYFDPKPATSGETRFSWSLGGGVKVMFHDMIGLRLQAKWTPTYINTSDYIFCDYWGWCYVIPLNQYMNQGEFIAGLVFRF